MNAEQVAENALATECLKIMATTHDLVISREPGSRRDLIRIKASDGRVLSTVYGQIHLSEGGLETLLRKNFVEPCGPASDDCAKFQPTELGRMVGCALTILDRH